VGVNSPSLVEGRSSVIEAPSSERGKTGPNSLSVVVVSVGRVSPGKAGARLLVTGIQGQDLTIVLGCPEIIPSALGVLRVRQERQNTTHVSCVSLPFGYPPIVGIDPPRELECLVGSRLLTRGQCLLARSQLRGQCLRCTALHFVEQMRGIG